MARAKLAFVDRWTWNYLSQILAATYNAAKLMSLEKESPKLLDARQFNPYLETDGEEEPQRSTDRIPYNPAILQALQEGRPVTLS